MSYKEPKEKHNVISVKLGLLKKFLRVGFSLHNNLANIYMFKLNKVGNFRKTCEICSKLTIKSRERRQ